MSTHRGVPGNGASLRGLREDASVDQTLQNLLRALTLNLELRSRYRVFEFEASQDGHRATAQLFQELRGAHGQQVLELMAGLQAHLGGMDLATPGNRVG